jgi:hypothetical protein
MCGLSGFSIAHICIRLHSVTGTMVAALKIVTIPHATDFLKASSIEILVLPNR